MATQDERLAHLLSKTQEARYEFLLAELEACFAGADRGIAELRQGDRAAAERAARKAESGYESIVHFLSVLDEGAQRDKIEADWTRLRERLDQLQEVLG